MVSIEDRILRIKELFAKVGLKRLDITSGMLADLYWSHTEIFGGRKYKDELKPGNSSSWRIMLTADNAKVDTWDKQCDAALRIEKVIRHFQFFDLNGIARPIDEASLIKWLVAIDDRLRDYLLDIPHRSDDEVFDAITCAFDLGKHELVTSSLQPRRYYGYRRSANGGDIIRFHFEIKGQSEKGIIRFDNYFLRSPHPWIVDGCGFTVGKLTHMIGTAKSSPGALDGRGVRFFTLQPYEFGWLVGLLDTQDKSSQPISARVVLVPVEQHIEGQKHLCDPGDKDFTAYLSDTVSPSELRKEVQVPAGQERILRGLDVDDLIQSLIFNGSLRTLHGEPQPIPAEAAHEGLRRLNKIQNRVLALGKQPPNDIYIFRHLLTNGDVYEAIDQYLSKLERRSRPTS